MPTLTIEYKKAKRQTQPGLALCILSEL